jgi:hypothetical protein
MIKQIPDDMSGTSVELQSSLLPLLPNKVPTVAATSPMPQKTDASPAANTKVGMVAFRSSRSPAAVDMYDMVKGKSPQTQGLTDVSKPAPYMIGRDCNHDDEVDAVAPTTESTLRTDDAN